MLLSAENVMPEELAARRPGGRRPQRGPSRFNGPPNHPHAEHELLPHRAPAPPRALLATRLAETERSWRTEDSNGARCLCVTLGGGDSARWAGTHPAPDREMPTRRIGKRGRNAHPLVRSGTTRSMVMVKFGVRRLRRPAGSIRSLPRDAGRRKTSSTGFGIAHTGPDTACSPRAD